MISTAITRRRLLGSAASMVIGLNAPSLHGQVKTVLKVRIAEDMQVLDPGYMIGSEAETTTVFATLPRLAFPKYDGSWSWRRSEFVSRLEQIDNLHIEFSLKPGFLWTGGFGELTAEDVKYSFERMPGTDWGGRWPTLDRVDITDKYSGVIVLKETFAPLWLIGIASESGTILCRAAMEQLGEQMQIKTELPAQNGPYLLSNWQPQVQLTLTRYPEWKGTLPDVDEFQLLIIGEDKSAELAFEAGEIDITAISTASLLRYKDNVPANSKILTRDGPYETWVGMNTENPKLSDVRVRKAIQRAIDVDSILEAAYGGLAPKSHGIVPPGVLGHRTTGYSRDVEAAKSLMAEAGVSNLKLDLKTLNILDRMTAAQIIQANLAEIGITLTITPVDSGTFWNLGLESEGDDWKSLEMWIMRYVGSPDPADHMQWFVKDQIGIWNWERWSDPEFEELWQQSLIETDPAVRQKNYVRMQEIMEDTGAYVWITHEPAAYIHRDHFEPELDPAGQLILNGFKLI